MPPRCGLGVVWGETPRARRKRRLACESSVLVRPSKRLWYPTAFPWHTHCGPVVVNVVSGEFTCISAEDCVGRVYPAGTALVDPGQGLAQSVARVPARASECSRTSSSFLRRAVKRVSMTPARNAVSPGGARVNAGRGDVGMDRYRARRVNPRRSSRFGINERSRGAAETEAPRS